MRHVVLAIFAAFLLSACGETDEAANDPIFQQGDNLYSAARAGDLARVQHHMQWGGGDAQKPDTDGGLPLVYAAEGGNVDVIRYLVQNGANPNAADLSGKTPLQAAEKAGHAEAVQALRDLGATQ